MKIIPIQFLKHYGSYHIGQIAGFPDEFAVKLIADGAAKRYVDQTLPEKRNPLRKMVSKKAS